MGNTSSTRERQETVDFGALVPFGLYTGAQDWNHSVVTQLIIERKLAPFYRPLEDYDESWDDEQILAARKEFPVDTTPPPTAGSDGSTTHPIPSSSGSSLSNLKIHKHHPRAPSGKDPQKLSEASLYRGAVECPICFMYYPPNINHSRCCDQAICTECFVQIKRAEPTTTHVVSEPAACPYCVQDNFGVTYTPPPWRAGIGAENMPNRPELVKSMSGSSAETGESGHSRGKRRSISHTSSEVVTVDQIRPDWEAKLAAVRAAVARRANRRIIMRQVGDRLIPVGVTSGRLHGINTDGIPDAGPPGEEGRRSGRRRNQDLSQLLGGMGLAGQDIEDLMVMEAMRLSLIEHEEQQRREAAARNAANGNASSSAGTSTSPSGSVHPLAIPAPRISRPTTPSGGSSLPASNRLSVLGRGAAATALAIGLPQPTEIGHRRSGSVPPRVSTPSAPPTPVQLRENIPQETMAVPAPRPALPVEAAQPSAPITLVVEAPPSEAPRTSHIEEHTGAPAQPGEQEHTTEVAPTTLPTSTTTDDMH